MFRQITELCLLLVLFSVIICSKLPENCGHNGHYYDESFWRIVGGQKSNITEWPWQVALKKEISLSGDPFVLSSCGGSLIHENWILTAAHCVHSDPDVHSYYVYLGYSDLNKKVGNELRRAVTKIVKHESFDYDLQVFDLALVKFNESIDFVNKHKYLRPVCLPNITNEKTDNCLATGYGYQSENGSTDKTLMKVSEPVFDISKCYSMMIHINKDRNICAGGSAKGGLGTCKGDSGGPLQCLSKDGKWYQIGITSWGQPCAHPNTPDVFTRVAYFRDWVEKVVENN